MAPGMSEPGPGTRVMPRTEPPSNWCHWWADLTRLTDEIYYGWPENEDTPNPWFWHWCAPRAVWIAQSTDAHTLLARDPLHLEASLLWPCCDVHGFCRGGEWIPA